MNYDSPQFVAAVKRILGRYWQPKAESVPPKDTTTQEGDIPPKDVGFVPETTPTPERQKETCHCKPDQTPTWKKLLETAAVLVGIYVAYIYHGQLVIMQGQLGEIIRQFPEIQKSANASVKSADQTEKAVREATENFKVDQRAWVGIFEPSGQFQDLLPVGITLPIKNTGKTAAVNMVIETDWGVHDFTGPRRFPRTANFHRTPLGALIPGGQTVFFSSPYSGDVAEAGNAQRRTMLSLGVHVPYIYGRFSYNDIFDTDVKHQHWIDFCYEVTTALVNVAFKAPNPVQMTTQVVVANCGEHTAISP